MGGSWQHRNSAAIPCNDEEHTPLPLKILKTHGKVGYAGGFNPDNVAEKLSFLMENSQVGDFWIDMESGVRTDDWFDTDKVRRVLRICKEVIRDLGVED